MTAKSPKPPLAWAAKVDELLVEQRKTRTWLAAEIGAHKSTLTKYMNGDRPIHPAQLSNIARVLGIPAHWLETESAKEVA